MKGPPPDMFISMHSAHNKSSSRRFRLVNMQQQNMMPNSRPTQVWWIITNTYIVWLLKIYPNQKLIEGLFYFYWLVSEFSVITLHQITYELMPNWLWWYNWRVPRLFLNWCSEGKEAWGINSSNSFSLDHHVMDKSVFPVFDHYPKGYRGLRFEDPCFAVL